MPNLDDATKATEKLFENESQLSLEDAPQTEETQQVEETVEPPVEGTEQPTEPTMPDDAVLNEAINTAEIAAQAAQQKDMELQQALQEIETLRTENKQLQGTIEELSNQNKDNLIEEALAPPTLDINGLAFADEETIANAQAEFAQKMSEYNRQQILKELEPTLEYAKKGMQEAKRAEVLSDLSKEPMLAGINDMIPQIENIIANNPWLQSNDMSLEEKYINAYAIARGVNAINTPPAAPKELTSEEMMELYNNNPEFRQMVEKKMIETLKESQQVPVLSGSSGAGNAALNINEKPKTLEDASKATRRMLGLE